MQLTLKEIPAFFNTLIQEIAAQTSSPSTAFRELLVTEYPPGSVINWHRDAPPFDLIAGISLHTDCTFRCALMKRNNNSTVLLFH